MDQGKQSQALSQIEALLNALPREELIRINKIIVQRIRTLDNFRAMAANAQYMPGDRVEWRDNFGQPLQGFVIRVNAKTISVVADNDPRGHWKVSASLLTKI